MPVDIPELEKQLRLSASGETAQVNLIHLNLLKKLKLISESKMDLTDQSNLKTLMEDIINGQIIELDEFDKIPFSTSYLRQQIKRAIIETKNQYDAYCKSQYRTFREITAAYGEYFRNGSGLEGYWNRFAKGYAYHGRHEHSPTKQPFIQLVDRLALIDSSGKWIGDLQTLLNRQWNQNQLGFAQQMELMQYFYNLFEKTQKQYFDDRKKQQEEIIQQLIVYYNIPNIYQTAFKQDTQVISLIDLNDFPIEKLQYDLDHIKEALDEQDEEFQRQLKEFKKVIHHVAQQLGLPSQIQKRAATNKDPSIYYVETDLTKCKLLISPQQQRKRQLKGINENIAEAGATTSSIGEAFVAISVIIPAWFFCPPLAIALIFGFLTFHINRLLFKDDSYTSLNAFLIVKQILVNGRREEHRLIDLDKDGQPISFEKKVAIRTIGCLCLFAGIVSGILDFMSTLQVILFSHNAIVVGFCMAGAAFPALGMAIGLTSIFFRVIADAIKNDRLKQIYNYIKKEFFGVPWNRMSNTEKYDHIKKCAGKVFLCLIAVAITTVVTVASFGVYYEQCLGFFGSGKAARVFSSIACWINSIISAPFQVESSNKVLQSMAFKRHTFAGIKSTAPAIRLSPVQEEAATLRKIETVTAVAAAVGSSIGIGDLNQSDSSPFSSNARINQGLTFGSSLPYSGLPNMSAAIDTIGKTRVDPQENKEHKERPVISLTQRTTRPPPRWRFSSCASEALTHQQSSQSYQLTT